MTILRVGLGVLLLFPGMLLTLVAVFGMYELSRGNPAHVAGAALSAVVAMLLFAAIFYLWRQIPEARI